MHSFHAFIDESGDEGFFFKEPPERAASEWFVVSAIVVRDKLRVPVSNELNKIIGPLEAARKSPIHFIRLTQDQKKYLAHSLSKLSIRLIHVCVNKKSLTGLHGFKEKQRLHHYCLRLLIERISWMCRDKFVKDEGDGRCKLNFSRCKSLSYEVLSTYFSLLKNSNTKIEWKHIDAEKLNVVQHDQSLWMRAVDVAASGLAKGLELSEYGLCEDSYARLFRPITYTYNKKAMGYGLKFFPEIPEPEKERDNRYEWLSLYR